MAWWTSIKRLSFLHAALLGLYAGHKPPVPGSEDAPRYGYDHVQWCLFDRAARRFGERAQVDDARRVGNHNPVVFQRLEISVQHASAIVWLPKGQELARLHILDSSVADIQDILP
jgi:hypothetical protein